jgi:uncharacterized membrane protein
MHAQPPAKPEPSPPTGGMVETWIGRLLTCGVVISATVLLLGGAGYLWRSSGAAVQMSEYRPQPDSLSRPLSILRGAAALHPEAILQLGIMLLILTPVARVALALLLFLISRDRVYVVVSLIVLSVLALGLAGVV